MPTYSHSRISCFETCKLQFKYQYIDKLKTAQEDTVETFLGSLVHEALEKLYKDLLHEKRNTKEELSAWFFEEWTKRWDGATIKIVREEYSAENYRDMGVRFLNDYYDHYSPFSYGKTLGLETEELLDLNDDYKYHIRIDRLCDAGNGIYEIHDYKTSGSMKTQDDLEEDRQLAMYAYWVHQAFPDAKKVKLIWHFLAFNKEMVVEKRLDHLVNLKKEVLLKIGEIEACTDFPPMKSALCSWCAYQKICPLWKHLFATEEMTAEHFKDEDGVMLANEYANTKEKIDELNKQLSVLQERIYAFGAKNDIQMLYGSAVKVNIWMKETVKLPGKNDPASKVLAQLLKAQGIYDEYSTVDTWKLCDALTNGKLRITGYNPPKEKVQRLYLSQR